MILSTHLGLDGPLKITLVPGAGAMLPIRDNGHAYEVSYRAMRTASGLRTIYHSRYQLFVFSAEEDREAAERWASAVAEGYLWG